MNVGTPIATNGGDWVARFGADWSRQVTELRRRFGEGITETRLPPEALTDVPIVYVRADRIVDVLSFVKSGEGFEYAHLSDLTATDEWPAVPRFEIVYNLYSPARHWRLRLKVRLAEGERLPSVTGVWAGANWAEREVFDMYGIEVAGHPDLRRILNDGRFTGHPLRKDYDIHRTQLFDEPEPINEKLLE